MIAISWWETANCYLEEDDISQATHAYSEAITIFQQAGHWHGYGKMVFSWCWNAPREIPREVLIHDAQRALESVERELPQVHSLQVQGNLCLGKLYRYTDQLAEAERSLQAAIAKARPGPGGDHRFLGMAYTQLGALYREHQRPVLALEAFSKNLHHQLDTTEPNLTSLASVYQNLAATAMDLDRHEEGLAWMRKGIAVRAQAESSDPRPHLIDIGTLASSHYDLGRLDSAAHWFQFLLQTTHQRAAEFVMIRASAHMNLGVVLSDQGKYQAALPHLDSCATILQNLPSPNLIGLGKLYLNMGSIYLEMGELAPARAYGLQALEVNRQANFPTYSDANGNLYNQMVLLESEPEEKVNWLRKAIRSHVNQPLTQAQTILALAQQFRLTQEYDSAEWHLQQTTQLISPEQKGYPDLPIRLLEEKALLARDREQMSVAISLLKAAHHQQKRLAFPNPLAAKPAIHLAKIYAEQAKFDSAYQWIQYSLKLLDLHNPSTHQISRRPTFPTERIERMTWFTKLSFQLANKSGEAENLEEVLALVDSTLSLYNKWLPGAQQTETILASAENSRILNELGARVSIDLYRMQEDSSYLERAFLYAGQAQGTALQLNQALARQQGQLGIPDSLFQRERQLLSSINSYEQLLQQAKETDAIDSVRWKNLSREALQLQQAYESLQQQLINSYPQYRNLQQPTPIDISSLQKKLPSPSHALLQFLRLDSIGYQFLLTTSSLEFQTFQWDDTIDQTIDLFRFSPDSNRSQAEWMEASYLLYQRLWQPLELAPEITQLTLIPDGTLAYVPFESLVSLPNPTDYKTAPYLLRDYRLTYAFSLSNWMNSPSENRVAPRLYGGFAPVFDFHAAQLPDTSFILRDGYRWDQPAPLPGTREEVQSAQQLLGGEAFLGEAASETHFKQTAHEYQILHLATHGLVHAQRPLQSRLLLGEVLASDQQAEDGLLHAYELLGLDLQAELVLLSACHTGYGPMIEGEGPLSLAWAFAQAGCPTSMVSLWQANDEITARITSDFVGLLADGLPKDEALRQAKLAFLADEGVDAFQANPRNWAALVLMGEVGPIHRPIRWWPWGILGLLLAGGLGLLLGRSQKDNRPS